MTDEQLEQIKQFVKSFDGRVDQFHDSHHAELTVKYALLLSQDYPGTDLKILEAACWMHDIGRMNVEEGHPEESARLAKPFLEEIQILPEEAEIILHAIAVHGIKRIHEAKTIEAKLLFDADKIQQLSVYGFLRMTFFSITVQKMNMLDAVDLRWKTVKERIGYIQTDKAKEMLRPEIEKIEKLVQDFRNGLQGTMG